MTRELRVFGPYTTTERNSLSTLGTLPHLTGIFNISTNVIEFWDANKQLWLAEAFLRAAYDPGNIVVGDGEYLLQYQELILSGTEELLIQGTGEVVIFNLPSAAGGLDSIGRG